MTVLMCKVVAPTDDASENYHLNLQLASALCHPSCSAQNLTVCSLSPLSYYSQQAAVFSET